MLWVALIGCTCLILLKFTSLPREHGSTTPWITIICWMAGVGVSSFLIYATSQRIGFVQNSEQLAYIKHNLDSVLMHNGSLPENIIFIEGGSHAARGVDYQLLQTCLQDEDYSALVLQFSFPGANHFERMWALDRFSEWLDHDSSQKLMNRNLIILREAYSGYDYAPLAQFKRNLYRDRALSYLQPSIALLATYGYLVFNHDKKIPIEWDMLHDLVNHGLINTFNIGLINRAAFLSRIDSPPPLFNIDLKNKTFKYEGIDQLLKETAKYTPSKQLYLGWKAKTVDRWILNIEPWNHIAYFGTPMLRPGTLSHLNRYKSPELGTMVLSYEGEFDFVKRFAHSDCWYDRGHLARKGAQIYTQWLSEKIIQNGLLVR